MKNVLLWLRIVRPQTLFASMVPVLIGLWSSHEIVRAGFSAEVSHRGLIGVMTLICSLSLQILSNLINDYYDYVRGTDKAGRAGFKRALAEGEVTKGQMKAACFIALGVAVCIGLYLVISGGLPILLIGVTAILFAWLYTATSHSLSYLGIADIFVFMYYGVLATAGTVWLQLHIFCKEAFMAGAVCGLISMCVLMVNNLRDMESDRASGKKTLPVRFGKNAAHGILLVIVLMVPTLMWLMEHRGISVSYCLFDSYFLVSDRTISTKVVYVPMMVIMMSYYFRIVKAEGAKYNICLLQAGIINVIYLLLFML